MYLLKDTSGFKTKRRKMIKEFVPEMRSDKKDAEIARLREQVRVLRDALSPILRAHETGNNGAVVGQAILCEWFAKRAKAALAATEE
mgnify:FL=1